jgi:hypothetical protein
MTDYWKMDPHHPGTILDQDGTHLICPACSDESFELLVRRHNYLVAQLESLSLEAAREAGKEVRDE